VVFDDKMSIGLLKRFFLILLHRMVALMSVLAASAFFFSLLHVSLDVEIGKEDKK